MHPSDTLPCFRSHMGLYAIEPSWLRQAVYLFQHGRWPRQHLPQSLAAYALATANASCEYFAALNGQVTRRGDALYSQIDTTALIRIVGQMTKAPDPKIGGTSTLLTRRAIRQAVDAEDIKSTLIAIDSPGGMVDGTMELADEIARAAAIKPLVVHIEGMGASAALWAAVQAQRITATKLSQVGSIGVFAEVIDSSGAAAREGIVVHIRSTGPMKGLGAPGTVIPKELLDEVDMIVAGIGAEFFAAVRSGRRLSAARLEAVTTGQVWLAPQAQALGLIDGVESFDQALDAASKMRPRRRMENADARAPLVAMATRLGIDLVSSTTEGM